MDANNRKKSIPDYAKLFKTLSKKHFLNKIFFSKKFVKNFSSFWKNDLDSKIKKIGQIFDYYHEDDLYEYFKINHSLHKNKPKFEYMFTLFSLLTDLARYMSIDDTTEIKDFYCSEPIYVYNQSPDVTPELSNLIRDFFYCGYSLRDIRIMYGYNPENFKKLLKKVYQEDLTPLDITKE
jgi:hypothetical protein